MGGRDVEPLLEVLEEARTLGLLGPGPVTRQYQHAHDLAHAIGTFTDEFLDLGSGGGVPGLVLLEEWPDARAVLVEAQHRRCDFLERAIANLDLDSRATVECGRSEQLARRPDLRSRFGLVVARSFGAPAVTAECAVGFLRVGGQLVVTEPPEEAASGDRWNPSGLAQLGFEPPVPVQAGETHAARLVLRRAPDDRWPRRDGVPAKRPLW
jgi:16S rRNA (guanine527-N7)-methyltransferase